MWLTTFFLVLVNPRQHNRKRAVIKLIRSPLNYTLNAGDRQLRAAGPRLRSAQTGHEEPGWKLSVEIGKVDDTQVLWHCRPRFQKRMRPAQNSNHIRPECEATEAKLACQLNVTANSLVGEKCFIPCWCSVDLRFLLAMRSGLHKLHKYL